MIYSATYSNTTGSNQSVSSLGAGWASYYGSAGTVTTTANWAALLTSASGTGDLSLGYARMNMGTYNATTSTTDRFSIVQTGLSLDLGNGATISWDATAQVIYTRVQVLIQLNNSDWYVSNTVFQPTNQGLNWNNSTPSIYRESLTFSTAAAGWSAFSLVGGNSMAIGSTLASDLPSSTVTGIGLYAYNTNTAGGTALFLDTLTVSVPEPATTALFVMAGCILLAAFRVKRSNVAIID